MSKTKKILAIVLVIVLIAAAVLYFTGVFSPKSSDGNEKSFTLVVTDINGNSETLNVSSSKSTVGEALLEKGIISGDDGPYGLYVKTVNGITADYDTDGTYWMFYINGEMAMNGVDLTDITDGYTYEFRVES